MWINKTEKFLFSRHGQWRRASSTGMADEDLARNSGPSGPQSICWWTRRFYRWFRVGVRERSRLCAFNTRWRGTFLARCNRMMIRYWPVTTHATLRGNSPLCGRLTRRENERGKCTRDERTKEWRREKMRVHI